MARTRYLQPGRVYAVNEFGTYMHDMIAEVMLGRPLRDNEWVDHINENGLDNRRANLVIYRETPNGPVRIFHDDENDDNGN